mgnify:CR=1 FL=1
MGILEVTPFRKWANLLDIYKKNKDHEEKGMSHHFDIPHHLESTQNIQDSTDQSLSLGVGKGHGILHGTWLPLQPEIIK